MRDGLWKLPEFKSRILLVLKLTYDRLPSYLKQCFVHCLIFPKSYWINKEKLVQLWIAEGFVKLTSGSEVLEDVANSYFMGLLQQSFFHDVVRDDFGQLVSCRMHDFIHDLAQFVAGVEFSSMSIGYPRSVCGYVQYCSSNSTQSTTPKAENCEHCCYYSLEKARQEVGESNLEQHALIDILQEERERREETEEKMRDKLREASNTISDLVEKVKHLERRCE
ncbi:hypothetical protein LWI28_004858 [Acer negundo]|uniref:Disease resistance protein winged helix domain-containing protein n=1 Tax=Acer negundo TaxID=4023 RepID=A0AAD5P246_ACENE|nr:hypothetical protein LWI28_004858 [Acer negundo]